MTIQTKPAVRVPWSPPRPGVSFPRWISTDLNLREVAPGLYVGDAWAVTHSRKWGFVVDLCGSSRGAPERYPASATLLRWDFTDGEPLPDGLLDKLQHDVPAFLQHNLPVLIHCAAGQSRSVSACYALLRVGWGLGHEEALARVQTDEGKENGWPMAATIGSARAWVHGQVHR